MASSLALKQGFTRLISRSLLRPVASSAARFFNTNATPQHDQHADDRNLDVDADSDRSYISRRNHYDYSTVIQHGPFLAFRNALDIRNPSEDFWFLLVDMPPGLSKEDVKIFVHNPFIIKPEDLKDLIHRKDRSYSVNYYTLIIKGKGLKQRRIPLLPNSIKLDQIKAEMKNGLIKLILPKIKKEEKRTFRYKSYRNVDLNVEIQ